jgi:DNA-binding SARP family transcriptional activator/tetratricopeptide (TPR) repeat protein
MRGTMARMPSPLRSVRTADRHVDIARERSASFPPPETRADPHPPAVRQPIAVGPGRQPMAMPARSAPLYDEPRGFPVQLSKVQPPALRSETLERPRLLDWLRSKTHGRVVLVLADAGFGKTTLLADYSRRTRLPTLWYRLDEQDRDWIPFLNHLVAAGREHSPAFAPQTAALLADAGPDGPDRDDVLDAFLLELSAIATAGALIVFDDFHLVDDSPDVRHITREILARAPDRVTVVIASRRLPTVPLGRLRALGEVNELQTDDLRFDLRETTQLFNQTFGRDLDGEVLAELANRTEGWIASLHLVQAALRDRSPSEIRRFIRGLSGADRELYDYLAEEVVGDLPPDLQQFLMETSVLQVITPELAGAASGLEPESVHRLTSAAERLTLLSRSTAYPRTHQRYHPLVREFLEARLRSIDGVGRVLELHRRVADTARRIDWRIAAHHYREGGDIDSMLDVVGGAIPAIMGNGQYALAEAFIATVGSNERPARFDVIQSRVDMQHGDYQAAIAASTALLESDTTAAIDRDHALLNLVTLYLNYGDGDRATAFAEQLEASEDPNLASIARASKAMVTGSESDDIDRINRLLVAMAHHQRSSRPHHFAVTQYNLASNLVIQDRPDQALTELQLALEILESGSAAIELAAARIRRAEALAMLGRVGEARAMIALAQASGAAYQEDEIGIGIADVFDSYLDADAAESLFSSLHIHRHVTPGGMRLAALSNARMLARRYRHDEAAAMLARYPSGRPAHLGIEAELRVTRAFVAIAGNDENALMLAEDALSHARLQGAHRWRRCAELLRAMVAEDGDVNRQVILIGRDSPHSLTYLADLLVGHLDVLNEEAAGTVLEAAALHPGRWRTPLRRAIDSRSSAAVACARVLETVGEKVDVSRLRRLAHELKRRPETTNLGRGLARHLADRVYVEDQGRVLVRIGAREVAGSDVRRKVLGLVCFLISRPQMSSTRDQVLEALWPDLDPSVAVNSLNQTLYFLRRVFEEDYEDDLSPGYVHHASDVIWLDGELVTSRSTECRALLRTFSKEPTPDDVEALVELYAGRFALDFEYEEWAGAYRDSLHAAYLEVVERSVLDDFGTGHHDRGIRVARRALDIDSSAENIEVSLLRLYRVTGAHSAAAEQYAHYATALREDLGLEPPPLESL